MFFLKPAIRFFSKNYLPQILVFEFLTATYICIYNMASKKKKNKLSWFIFLILLISGGLMLFFGIRWYLYYRVATIHYPAFNIPIPSNYMIHGIDVSRYQDLVAWEEVKKMEDQDIKLGFAFIKATEGIGNRDIQFKRNWRRSKNAGIVRGAYHFFLATKDGKEQAENFIKTVDLEKNDLPPVLDVELTYGVSPTKIRTEVKKWLDVAETYYGVRPIIYTNIDFYTKVLGDEFDDYPLWIAHYYQPGKPRIKRSWVFWQHSEEGRVNGIKSKVDFNVFNGDSTDFKNLLID